MVSTRRQLLFLPPPPVGSSSIRPLVVLSSKKENADDSPQTPIPISSPRKRARKSSSTLTLQTPTSLVQSRDMTLNSPHATPGSKLPALTRNQLSGIAPDTPYLDLKIPPQELRPSATLTTGQCFHWRVVEDNQELSQALTTTSSATIKSMSSPSAWGKHDATEWVGVLRTTFPVSSRGSLGTERESISFVVSIQETSTTTLYRILHGPPATDDFSYDKILRDYFQLDVPLAPLYDMWSKQDSNTRTTSANDDHHSSRSNSSSSSSDSRLARIAQCIPGVRLVKQDPWECLISFICSSNNNIPRITKMVTALREHYGEKLLTIKGSKGKDDMEEEEEDVVLYSFPSLDELRKHATEDDLRTKCGMGYRAKYIMATMETLSALGGESYLHQLRDEVQDPIEVQERLLVLAGVGRKVADCVALFSLNQHDAIPVDTHVWNICRRDYDDSEQFANSMSLTPTVYRQVGDVFRNRFTSRAGWAHSLLFVAELPSFRAVLPTDIVEDMDQFRQEEQRRKEALKVEKKERQAKKK